MGERHQLRPGMFVAQVVGRFMEPAIPDGAWCLFRAPVEGTRQVKTVLVQLRDGTDPETGERYTAFKANRSRSSQIFFLRLQFPHGPEGSVRGLGVRSDACGRDVVTSEGMLATRASPFDVTRSGVACRPVVSRAGDVRHASRAVPAKRTQVPKSYYTGLAGCRTERPQVIEDVGAPCRTRLPGGLDLMD